MTPMRLLSLNVWNTEEPYAARMDELRRFVVSERPDVIAMQEVAFADGEPQFGPYLAGLGYTSHCAQVTTCNGQVQGLAIATRAPSRRARFVPLAPAPGDLTRGALIAEVELPGGGLLRVLTAHLAFGEQNAAHRERQARRALDALAALPAARTTPAVLCVDLNEERGPAYDAFVCDGPLPLRDLRATAPETDAGPTFDARNPFANPAYGPGRTLDFIFASPAVRARSCTRVLTGEDGWEIVSDHYGLLAGLDAIGDEALVPC